jgi:TolB-like protein
MFVDSTISKTRFLLWMGVALALLVCQVGCAEQAAGPGYTRDGKEYGKVRGAFRHRWWNYYERGLSFAEGEFYQEALSDLRKAIDQRDEDQRMARTYGMHFIDYFPHRELGIVHYQMGKLDAAKRELELSLNQFPSAKAMFYLDRVRKKLIEQQGKDVPPPKLSLHVEEGEIWTREDPFIVSGMAEDDHFVAQVTINREPLFLELSEKRVPFSRPLSLSQGRHLVEVAAENLVGKITSRQIVVHVDRQGPMITLEEVKADETAPGNVMVITGSVYDEAGVDQLTIAGQSEPIRRGIEVLFTTRLRVEPADVEIRALDRLGNVTTAKVPVAYERGDRSPIVIACANAGGASLLAGIFGTKDTRPPKIQLSGWTESQTVFLEKIYLQGQVRDESKIESLTINHEPILRRKGTSIFFSHLADLKEGKNSILIEAEDEAANRSSRAIAVQREVPKALQLEERLSLTVVPFDQQEEASAASLSFQDNLIDALVDQNRFRVVERARLDVILQEQKLSRTDLIDRSTALRLGRLIAARAVIAGSIIETKGGIEIIGRLIDTETSEILATEDVFDEAKDLPALRSLAEGMAIKFHRDFPLVDGLVIERKGKDIFTDLGRSKIRAQRRLIIYREEPIKHPVTGKVLGADHVLIGRAGITQVMPEMSKAEIVDTKEGAIKRLDKVITE